MLDPKNIWTIGLSLLIIHYCATIPYAGHHCIIYDQSPLLIKPLLLKHKEFTVSPVQECTHLIIDCKPEPLPLSQLLMHQSTIIALKTFCFSPHTGYYTDMGLSIIFDVVLPHYHCHNLRHNYQHTQQVQYTIVPSRHGT